MLNTTMKTDARNTTERLIESFPSVVRFSEILLDSRMFLSVNLTMSKNMIIPSTNWTEAQYDATMGDIEAVTMGGEIIRFDVKQCKKNKDWCENSALNWEYAKRSISISETSAARFMGHLFVGCGPDMSDFYLVQRELAIGQHKKWKTDEDGERFMSVNVLNSAFHAKLHTDWLKMGAPRYGWTT